ncbi:MAG: hypothetical protein JSS65_08535 [Armatimonadetes bacterium]|nr:hypothetical protein [Armatimonadota bacterium]
MRSLCASLFLAAASAALAQNDDAYAAKVKQYTTEPFFLTDIVDHLPASKTVPSPMKHFGDVIGAPNVLHHVEEINGYMRALAKASPRVRVQSIGKSEDGREMIAVVISDEANLRKLEALKSATTLLGDPRKLVDYKGDGKLDGADAAAEKLIKEGLPIYYATGGMHSPEAGPPEMLMELAYRLAVEETPRIQEIRKHSVVMITPVIETDGRDRYVDTYLYRKKFPKKPAVPLLYWGNYVAHDNNRDNIGMALALSKNLSDNWQTWHPTVLHDLHQSVPYLYISTGTGPYNAWLDPITIDEWHLLAYHEVDEMTKRGVPGVWTHGFYDGWAPNYAFYLANGHNAVGRFYETFGGSGADTRMMPAGNSDRQWFRPNPPFPNVRWSARNNCNLSESALILGMENVAKNHELYLRNYYLKSKRSVLKPWTEGPAAYVLEAKKGREWNLDALQALLLRQGVEVAELQADQGDGKDKLSKGALVVRMDQPYCRMADMLLDKQYYRADDPAPYDDCGWTLGPLFDVKSTRIKDASVLAKSSRPAQATWADTPRYPVDHNKLPKVAIVHTWSDTQDEGWVRLAFEAAGVPYTYISVHDLRDQADLRAKFDVIVFGPTGGTPQGIVNGRPMTGDPVPWMPTKDFPALGAVHSSPDIRGGMELEGVLHLKRFVESGGLFICIGGTCRLPITYGLVSGVTVSDARDLFAPGGVYLAEKVSKTSPITARYDDQVGVYFAEEPLLSVGGGFGFGGRGRGGAQSNRPSGRGDATDSDVVQGRPPYTPKPLPPDGDDSGGFGGQSGPRPELLLRFASEDKLLISGGLAHGDELAGRAAAIRCPVGKGNVVLFAINPMWRQSTLGSWPLVFDAITNWDRLGSAEKKGE